MIFPMNAHLKRWITALIAIPLLLVIICFGSEAVFALFITALVVAAMVEYNDLVFDKGRRQERVISIFLALCVMGATYTGGPALALAVLIVAIPGMFGLLLLQSDNSSADLKILKNSFFGVFFVALMMSHFILIRGDDAGVVWIFFLIIMAFSSDVIAYYTGSTWGRRKLIPRVSAGKTVEGALGGMAGCVACCTIYGLIFLPDLWFGHAMIMGFLGSIFGILGDLSESVIKRASMAKDSGSLLPGHGGVLDRLDSFIFMAPFVYYYKLYVLVI